MSAPDGSQIENRFLGSAEVVTNIIATLSAALETLQEVAAATMAIPEDRRVRLRDWTNSDSAILVLGTDFQHKPQMTCLNKLMFDTLCSQALARPVSPARWTTWFFLDDMRNFPDRGGLPHLLTMGCASGIRVAFTCQNLEQLGEIYGTRQASELASLCANRSIFRQYSPTMAHWAAETTSDTETFEYSPDGNEDDIIDVDHLNEIKDRRFLRPRQSCTPSEFLAFPLEQQGRVFGCHISPALGGAILRQTTYTLPK